MNRIEHTELSRHADLPYPDVQEGEIRLPRQQREVLFHLASGMNEREIAESMGLSPRTVHNHIYKKDIGLFAHLGVHTGPSAVAVGYIYGLIDIDQATEGMDFTAFDQLGKKEKAVFQQVTDITAAGGDFNEVAENLDIKRRTVILHMNSIYKKLNLRSDVTHVITYRVGLDRFMQEKE